MRVLIALEDVSSAEHIFKTAGKTFGHIENVDFYVAYPEDTVTRRPEDYEEKIAAWGSSTDSIVESYPVSGPKPYDALVIDVINNNQDIKNLVIGPQESPIAQRLFGDAPNPMFTRCPVPITVVEEYEAPES